MHDAIFKFEKKKKSMPKKSTNKKKKKVRKSKLWVSTTSQKIEPNDRNWSN